MEDHEMQGEAALDLARFDEAFATAPTEGEDVPDGRYEVNVEKAELTKSQTSGNPMLKWTLRILGPSHEGRCLWKNNVIVGEQSLPWLKADLRKAGLVLEKLSDLPDNLPRLLDVRLLVQKRTNGEHSNVYITRRIEGSETAASTPF